MLNRVRRRQARPLEDSSSTRLPVWARDTITVVGALVAVVGVVLSVVQVFSDGEGASSVVTPQASIEEVSFEPQGVLAMGGFQSVDLASEVILFVRKQEGASEPRWIPVEATVTPDEQADAGRVNGIWNALFPVNEEGQFSWQVLIVEASGLGASGGVDDIRELGPESDLVVAASEEFVADG